MWTTPRLPVVKSDLPADNCACSHSGIALALAVVALRASTLVRRRDNLLLLAFRAHMRVNTIAWRQLSPTTRQCE